MGRYIFVPYENHNKYCIVIGKLLAQYSKVTIQNILRRSRYLLGHPVYTHTYLFKFHTSYSSQKLFWTFTTVLSEDNNYYTLHFPDCKLSARPQDKP